MMRLRVIGICLLVFAAAFVQAAALTQYLLPEQRFQGWYNLKSNCTDKAFSQIWRQQLDNLPKGISGYLMVIYQSSAAESAEQAADSAKRMSQKDQFGEYVSKGYKVDGAPWPGISQNQNSTIFTIRGISYTSANTVAQSAEIYSLSFSRDNQVVWLQVRQAISANELGAADKALKKANGLALANELGTYIIDQWTPHQVEAPPTNPTPKPSESTDVVIDTDQPSETPATPPAGEATPAPPTEEASPTPPESSATAEEMQTTTTTATEAKPETPPTTIVEETTVLTTEDTSATPATPPATEETPAPLETPPATEKVPAQPVTPSAEEATPETTPTPITEAEPTTPTAPPVTETTPAPFETPPATEEAPVQPATPPAEEATPETPPTPITEAEPTTPTAPPVTETTPAAPATETPVTIPPVTVTPEAPERSDKANVPRWKYEEGLLSLVLPAGWKVSNKAPYQFTGLPGVTVYLYPWEPYKTDEQRDQALNAYVSDQRDIAVKDFSQTPFAPDNSTGVMVRYTNVENKTVNVYYFAKSGRLWQLLVYLSGENAPLPEAIAGMAESLLVR